MSLQELRDRVIVDFQRQAALTAALQLLSQECAQTQDGFRPDEIVTKIRQKPGCAGLSGDHILQAVHIFQCTAGLFVEPEQRDHSPRFH